DGGGVPIRAGTARDSTQPAANSPAAPTTISAAAATAIERTFTSMPPPACRHTYNGSGRFSRVLQEPRDALHRLLHDCPSGRAPAGLLPRLMAGPPGRRAPMAWLLFFGLALVYNSNGREMPTYDSQPTKFAARELALYGRLTLDRIIAREPAYRERS